MRISSLRKDAHLGPIVRNDSPELKKALAAFMKTHGPGTTFGNVVIQRYTRDNRWVRNPGTTEDLRRFKEALPYFQKYAKQYEFDYLLIAAQAYQESRINQKLKSPAGAVGVMQIKPTTASDPNVRIANVSAMDSNVHAGVKYLRFVSDRYFSDAKFDELNRHVFAFAAYNAGPARIQELRTTAAKEGLDPNEWFNNVEIIAGRKIGRETVDYVRNILKYWVAYHLALDLDEDVPATLASARRPRGEQVAHVLCINASAHRRGVPDARCLRCTTRPVFDEHATARARARCSSRRHRQARDDFAKSTVPSSKRDQIARPSGLRGSLDASRRGAGRDCATSRSGTFEPAPRCSSRAGPRIRLHRGVAGTDGSVAEHVRRYGYDQVLLKVDALASTANNARQIRDALLAMPVESGPARLVLIGYSKGAPDILDALVTFPEIRSRVAAVVSAGGAVGGSPLANDAEEYHAELLRHFPGAICNPGDGTAVASLRPAARRAWLAANPLPTDVRYYSLVTFPQPERISSVLKSSYRKLARIDSRNDGQLIFYDQVIPGSHLMAYINADHWALAVPIARTHSTIGAIFVTQNAYPREALVEALLRFVEEDLSNVRTHLRGDARR